MDKLNTWGFTQVNADKYSYLWTIKNFSCISSDSRIELESPIFSPDCDSTKKFCLIVWPNGRSDKNYVAIAFSNKNTHYIDVKFSIAILDKHGSKCQKYKNNTCIPCFKFDEFPEFVRKDLLNEPSDLLVDDVITIFCEYSLILDSSISTVTTYSLLKLKPETLDAFEQQLDTEEFSDFTLIAPCGKKLFVHKFILAARSPVFSAMIRNNMKEKKENTVTIKDVEYDVLKEMLRFMYSAKIENLDNLVYELLAAAEKYQIDGLKTLCEEYFFRSINLQNMKDILDISIRYKLDNLKDHVYKYVVCYLKPIFDNVGFESAEKINILAEACHKLKLN